MNKKTIIIVAIIIAGLIGASAFALTRSDDKQSDNSMEGMDHSSMNAEQQQTTEESATYKEFAALKGEEYDRMFLAGMIAHHQGAVDMAKLVPTNGKHEELKTMAQAIITAQQKEIADMTAWQSSWGYPASSGDNMVDHSAMGMEDDMIAMTEQLKTLTGDDFDRKFLELMIEHHQGAIDMARPGEANAQHQEVKTLAKAIVADQEKEISQMKAWQNEWGY